jgi:phosphopantothenate-cysteine ligase
LVKKELKTKKYDVVINLAAVSDYKPKKTYTQKIKSGQKGFCIELVPTPKIISLIKRYDPKVFLIQFKLEASKSKRQLIEEAYRDLLKNNSDLVVANNLSQIDDNKHIAYIIDRAKNIKKVTTKKELASKILRQCLRIQ